MTALLPSKEQESRSWSRLNLQPIKHRPMIFEPNLTSATLRDAINAGNRGIAMVGDEISAMVTLTIAENGDAQFIFDLPILNDQTPEGNEIFMVTLSQTKWRK